MDAAPPHMRQTPTYAEESSEDYVEVVYVREPSIEQAALAKSLLLPLTFFCYQNEPVYTSDNETDDEDYESAVKSLNGKLYADPMERGAAASHAGGASDPDCQVVWEKKPTPEEEEEKAKSLQLPTFFCELGTSDSEGDKAEEFETEVRKVQEALVCTSTTEAAGTSTTEAAGTSTTEAAVSTLAQGEANLELASEAKHTVPSNGCPIDLSTREDKESDSTTNGEEKEGDEEVAADDVDIHFEPIVSLPEVETKSVRRTERSCFEGAPPSCTAGDRQLHQLEGAWHVVGRHKESSSHPVKGSNTASS
ncbi:hypothetical protein CRUP_034832 [Coryphaenoides rupestris]|nr:hypothetical protein CRUP_034832 [Coryphaenoides rupestris]